METTSRNLNSPGTMCVAKLHWRVEAFDKGNNNREKYICYFLWLSYACHTPRYLIYHIIKVLDIGTLSILHSYLVATSSIRLAQFCTNQFFFPWNLTIAINEGSKILQFEVHITIFLGTHFEIWQPWHAFSGNPEK